MRLCALAPLLVLSVLACHDSPTAPDTGQLAVAIDGLPPGAPSAVIVSGAGSFRELLESSRTLASLPAGTYTIAASDVATGGGRYSASPASQTVSVGGGVLTTATVIEYRVATARLTVIVSGLPGATLASATVRGPLGFARTLTATTQLDLLAPGAYTIAASDVDVSGRTYRASPATQVVELPASIAPMTATIAYGAGTGVLEVTIVGLPTETAAAVSIAGPGGFARRMSASSTLANLETGSYTVTADVVGSSLITHRPVPASQPADVADGRASTVTVTYGSAPLQLNLQLAAEGLVQPVFLTAPVSDARQFIVERPGRIRILVGGSLLATPFLDIRTRVNNTGERGMLSMAFDPGYASNGRVYVYYVNLAGNMVVERFASTPGADVAGASTGIVMDIPHGGNEHHGGLIAFGPDGMLYVAPGDGGCCGDPQNNAQNLNSLLGKMLRIDVRSLPYAIPADNPFIGRPGARPEIWAYGLRNPWRFSFDASDGRLYVGDVGQDAREELDIARTGEGGLNYGWPLMEGTACYRPTTNCEVGQSLVLPAMDYPHSEGCSITGGYVYRGSAIPELSGHYLYSDYCRGWLRSLKAAGAGAAEHRTWAGIVATQAVSFGRDGAGELYLIAGTRVWRLVRQDG